MQWRPAGWADSQTAMRDITHFIDGQSVAGTSGRFGEVFNPNTGEVQAKVALAKRAEVEQAIAVAEAAQQAWAATRLRVAAKPCHRDGLYLAATVQPPIGAPT